MRLETKSEKNAECMNSNFNKSLKINHQESVNFFMIVEVGIFLIFFNMVLSTRAENPIFPRWSCCCMYQLPMIHYALFHQNVMCQYSDATACRQTILRSTARSKFKSRGWSCQKIAHLSVKRGSFCLKKIVLNHALNGLAIWMFKITL